MSRNSPYRVIVVWLFSIALLVLFFDAILPQESDTLKIKTRLQLSANELSRSSNTYKDDPYKAYIEDALEIKGVVKEITHRKGVSSLLLEGNSDERYIICEMQKDQEKHINNLNIGDSIVIKGIYKGTLVDAILLNCIILEAL